MLAAHPVVAERAVREDDAVATEHDAVARGEEQLLTRAGQAARPRDGERRQRSLAGRAAVVGVERSGGSRHVAT